MFGDFRQSLNWLKKYKVEMSVICCEARDIDISSDIRAGTRQERGYTELVYE